MTSRTKRYGKAGDTFEAFGVEFRITGIERMPLEIVAYGFYEEEGFGSPEVFIEIWEKIHPIKKFQPSQKVYAHFFKRIA